MKLDMCKVQRMADLQHSANHVLVNGPVMVQFFKPYTRPTWEFRVNGNVVDRRYSPKTAAALYVELVNQVVY